MAKKRGRGRPKIAKEARKRPRLTIRFDEAEYATIHKAADRAGQRPSTWARERLIEAAQVQKRKL